MLRVVVIVFLLAALLLSLVWVFQRSLIYLPAAAVGKVHYGFLPVRMLLRDTYPLLDHLGDVTVPVTVVYGAEDSIVPPGQSRAVAAAAPELFRLVQVPYVDHNDPELLDGELLIAAVVDLAEQIDATP